MQSSRRLQYRKTLALPIVSLKSYEILQVCDHMMECTVKLGLQIANYFTVLGCMSTVSNIMLKGSC